MVLCFLLCYTFKFSYCYLIHQLGGKKEVGKETSLEMDWNQPEKLLPSPKEKFHLCKRKKKKKNTTQSKPGLQLCNQFSNYRRCCPLLQNGALTRSQSGVFAASISTSVAEGKGEPLPTASSPGTR